MMATKNIVETATEAGTFTTLLAAAQAAGLVDALNGDGPLTVFAPTDDAFTNLPEGALDTLLANPDALARVIKAHVIAADCDSACVLNDGPKVTLDPSTQLLGTPGVDGAAPTVRAYGDTNVASIATADIRATNGVIHVIDKVLLPTVELSVDLSCANDGQVLDVADDGVMLKWSLNWEEPVPAVAEENNIYRVKFAMHLGDFEYKWKNGEAEESLIGKGYCAPKQNPTEGFANRKWNLSKAENVADTFAQCLACGAAWDVQPVNLTLSIPDANDMCVSPAGRAVSLKGTFVAAAEWWNDPGVMAVDNGDGTYTATINPDYSKNIEYLWVVDGVQESMVAAAATCEAINSDYSGYANRMWLIGSGDQADQWQSCTACEGVEPPAGGMPAGGAPAGGEPAGGAQAGGAPAGGAPAGGEPAAGGAMAGGSPDNGPMQIIEFLFDAMGDGAAWMGIASSAGVDAVIEGGALKVMGTNATGMNGEHSSHGYQFMANDIDFMGAASATFSFDAQLTEALNAAAIHVHIETSGGNLVQEFDLQNKGLVVGEWAAFNIPLPTIAAGNTMLRIHFELALGAVAGASASMLVDNIRVVAGELADDMPMGGEMAGDMNRFANGDFEMTEAGADPPFNPPTGWSAFGAAQDPFAAVGYNNYATQANGDAIFPTQNPYQGYEMSRGIKMWGRGADGADGNKLRSLSTIYQEWPERSGPSG